MVGSALSETLVGVPLAPVQHLTVRGEPSTSAQFLPCPPVISSPPDAITGVVDTSALSQQWTAPAVLIKHPATENPLPVATTASSTAAPP